MLTIKKSYPFDRKYVYGSVAFIVGYAGILSALAIVPQRVAYDNMVQLASESAKVEQQKTGTSSEVTAAQTPAQRASTGNTPIVAVPSMPTESAPVETPVTPEPTTPTVPTTPTEPTTPIVTVPPVVVPEIPIPVPTPDPDPETPPAENGSILEVGILGIEVKL